MSKLPWESGIPGAGHRERTGSDDLQTDVMRFMAILAFCLMAIFALVKSIGQSPIDGPRRPEPISATPRAAETKTLTQVPEQGVETESPVLAEPALSPERIKPVGVVLASPRTEVAGTSPVPLDVDEGFSLQFESNAVLRLLVEAGQVALYTSLRSKTWRVAVNQGKLSFYPARSPTELHLMTPATVPPEMVQALRRAMVTPASDEVTWGVTLPVSTTTQLRILIDQNDGGALVIRSDGQVNIERSE